MDRVMIFSLGEIPLGAIVKKQTEMFDIDPEARYKILSAVFADSAYPLSRDEVDERFKEETKLSDFPSANWPREMALGYHELIELFVARLRGKRAQIILTPDELDLQASVDAHRDEWLKSNKLREAVASLLEKLKQAIYWYNLQLMNTWIDRTRHCIGVEIVPKEIAGKELGEQLDLIDQFTHSRGNSILGSDVPQAYENIESSDASESTKALFTINRKQLTHLAAVRMGRIKGDPSLFEPKEPKNETSEEQWTQTDSGIIIPNK